MGNEEILLHFRLIHINVYVNQAWVVGGMSGILQMWMGCEICRP
ncbi:MAG: hypothetical protein NT010_07420 [Proteobacteria bacterium]|nr:hypothetical protein [Pseudomonadota bacterium]